MLNIGAKYKLHAFEIIKKYLTLVKAKLPRNAFMHLQIASLIMRLWFRCFLVKNTT